MEGLENDVMTVNVEGCDEPGVLENLKSLGFHIPRPEPPKKKGFIGRFLDRLAESNGKTFGSKPLDCCTVGRDEKKRP